MYVIMYLCNLTDFVAELQRLMEHCDFGAALNDML